jgi:hypothetical protein
MMIMYITLMTEQERDIIERKPRGSVRQLTEWVKDNPRKAPHLGLFRKTFEGEERDAGKKINLRQRLHYIMSLGIEWVSYFVTSVPLSPLYLWMAQPSLEVGTSINKGQDWGRCESAGINRHSKYEGTFSTFKLWVAIRELLVDLALCC